jgi:hypothetical protein
METPTKKHANSTTFDETQAREFMQAIFAGKDERSHYSLFYLPSSQAQFFPHPTPLIEAAAKNCKGQNVYIQTCTASKVLPKRMSAEHANCMYAVWMDLDVDTPEKPKPTCPKTKDEALDFLKKLPEPTVVVDSGHGYHVWWVFHTPVKIETEEDRARCSSLSTRWKDAINAVAHKVGGWKFDSVQDLARILRLPGSFNLKNGERLPVRIAQISDRKYSTEEIEAFITANGNGKAPATVVDAPATVDLGPAVDVDGLKLDPQANPPQDKLEVMLDTSPRFKAAWEHSEWLDIRDKSASGYDESLACQALVAGWNEQEIANLIIACRRRHGADLEKVTERKDYVKRTLDRAKEFLAKHAAESEQPPVELQRDWPEPENIFDSAIIIPTGTDMPGDILPEVLQVYATDEAQRLGVPPAALGLGCLVVCSSLITDEISITPKLFDTSFRRSPRLWGLIAGDVGAKKSPTLQSAVDPLDEIDRDLHAEWQVEDAEYQIQMEAYEQAIKGNKNRFGTPVKPVPPPQPRVKTNNFTMEALSDILSEKAGNKKIAVIVDEMSRLIASMDCYKPSGSAGKDRGMLLELHNGGFQRIDRVTRGQITVPNWSACVLGGIQTALISSVINASDGDGLAERFLVAFVENKSLLGEDRSPNAKAKVRYRDVAWKLYRFQREMVIKQSNESHAIYEEVLRTANDWTRLPECTPGFVGHIAKWQGMIAQILLTSHMIEWAMSDSPGDPPRVIAPETAERVKRLALKLLLPSSLKFHFDVIGESKDMKLVKQICSVILAHGLETIDRRFIQMYCRASRSKQTGKLLIDDVTEAMVLLEQSGWVRPEKEGRWSVNPAIHVRFKDQAKFERAKRSTISGRFEK